jgi:hypothetical protein
MDDVLARVAAAHDAVDGAFVFDAESARHGLEETTQGGPSQANSTKNIV